jgi:manganese/iron transport system substrate-binding protein
MFMIAGCAAPAAPAAPSGNGAESPILRIVTTVSPITNIAYNIAGDRAQITGIVPEGVNSHTFEPAPSDAKTMAEADLIFINGLKLEEPTLALAEANKNDEAEIVLLGELTVTPEEYVFDFSFPKAAGSPNPHLWPNPDFGLRYAEIIRDTLAARDPAGTDYYNANYTAFAARIEALKEAIRATINSIPEENRKLLTYHDSWAYFAPIYGMTVIGAIQPSDLSPISSPRSRRKRCRPSSARRFSPRPSWNRLPRNPAPNTWMICAMTTCRVHPARRNIRIWA